MTAFKAINLYLADRMTVGLFEVSIPNKQNLFPKLSNKNTSPQTT